jgi:hypothetical protein
MANESSIVVGSGLNPLKRTIPENQVSHERHLRGTNAVIINPEDSSVGASGLVSMKTVGSLPTKLPTTPMRGRRAIAIYNNSSSVTLYLGFDSSLLVSTGWPLPPGASIPFDMNADIEIYGVASSNVDVRILELS